MRKKIKNGVNIVKLDYQLNQTVYTVERTSHAGIKLYEDKINRIEIKQGEQNYYTTRDGYFDDIRICKSWTGMITFSRQKSPDKNPEIILGHVFTNKKEADKYLRKMNHTESERYKNAQRN